MLSDGTKQDWVCHEARREKPQGGEGEKVMICRRCAKFSDLLLCLRGIAFLTVCNFRPHLPLFNHHVACLPCP